MDYHSLAIQSGITVAAALAAVCLFGIFEHQLREILGTFFALLLRPLLLINDSLRSFWRGVEKFYRGQFSRDGQLNLQQVFFQFIGAVLYTIFFFAFNYSEFHLLALSFVAAGIDAGHFYAPIGAGLLTAFALIASFLFWGAIILDLSGVTNIAPWREALDEKWKHCLLYIALFCLVLSLFVSSTMGLFRGKVIADESLPSENRALQLNSGISDSNTGFFAGNPMLPEQVPAENSAGLYYWIPIIANVCIPILVGIGGLFAGWGVVTLIKFVMLLVGFLIIAPLGLFLIGSSLLVTVVDRLYQFIDAILQLLAAMGHRFMGIFGWNPQDSRQTENQGNDISAVHDEVDNHPDSQCSSEASPEDDQSSSNEQGWDPFKK
jgi:hypothetical protein